ncbi:MAG TPA: GNAT family N-acetyltransferase [Segetibacter sp.]|jgi:N-acetylglutamate synthase-like GNAT family acetyltransferase
MNIVLRSGRLEDAAACGAICYQAFATISNHHNFPPDFPNAEVATGLMNSLLTNEYAYSVVAEVDGKIIGSNFLHETRLVGGVGPITVDPNLQNSAVGKKLMQNVLQRAEERQMAGVRLVQAAYHNRSLSLYTKLGFDAQEPLSVMQGLSPGITFPEYHVRAANETDLESCNQVCVQVHGHDRGQELLGAIKAGTATVVEYNGRITGYATYVGFFGHTVALTNVEIKALIAASASYAGPGFLLPTRNSEVLRWCLNNGLRIVQPFTLMSKGLYNQPAGAFLPSILY